MTSPDGFCPKCEDSGVVGLHCARPACARRGFHCIPLRYFPEGDTVVDRYVGQRWGNYLLVKKLGQGGVGAVYLALQEPLMMETALKVLAREHQTAGLAERFVGEARALAKLKHPNIVRLLQFGDHAGQPYIVMEYVDGGQTLADLHTGGQLSPELLWGLVQQAAHGLEAAHQCGVVHRDIKPANIMVQPLPGGQQCVRLVDFGLAKFADSGSSTQVVAGTPSFMAPEQIAKSNIGPWTDWYALGVVAFELLTGAKAFGHEPVRRTLLLKADPYFDPASNWGHLRLAPPTLAFFRRVMAFEPAHRPQNAAAFLAELYAAMQPYFGGAALPQAGSPGRQHSTDMHGEAALSQPQVDVGSERSRPLMLALLAILVGVGLGSVFMLSGADEPPPAAAARDDDAPEGSQPVAEAQAVPDAGSPDTAQFARPEPSEPDQLAAPTKIAPPDPAPAAMQAASKDSSTVAKKPKRWRRKPRNSGASGKPKVREPKVAPPPVEPQPEKPTTPAGGVYLPGVDD